MLKTIFIIVLIVPFVFSQTAIEIRHNGEDSNGLSTYSRVTNILQNTKTYRLVEAQKKENRLILYLQTADKGNPKISPIAVVITYLDITEGKEYYLYSWLFWYVEKDPELVVNGIISLVNTIREHEKYKALLNKQTTK